MSKQAAWTGVPGSVDRRKLRTVRQNVNERAFEELALAKGWAFTKRGWPDFLCFDTRTNEVIAVEVKPKVKAGSRMKLLRPEQATCMDFLESKGIKCLVSDGFTLEPYSRVQHCNERIRREYWNTQRRFNITRGQGGALPKNSTEQK